MQATPEPSPARLFSWLWAAFSRLVISRSPEKCCVVGSI